MQTSGMIETNAAASPNNVAVPGVTARPTSQTQSHGNESSNSAIKKAKIMIVDDEQLVIRVVRRFLASEGYTNFLTVTDSRQAFERIRKEKPDIVLLDIMMPHVSGIDLLQIRQQDTIVKHIPFIILSANSEKTIKREALKLGATDFLAKPVDAVDLVLRVQNSLIVKQHQDQLTHYAVELEKQVQQRTRQIDASREQIIHCLAKAAEFRDNETGAHVIRVGKYAAVIAKQLGFGPNYCRQIELAAQLHDVGKIGIPDSILLNPGKLTREEFDVMKEHCRLGCQIMEPLARAELSDLKQNGGKSNDTPMLALAANIARTHHEKWDGTGYPDGLKGEEIPIEGRITTVADVYDALCSERPYKPKFPREKCLEIMLSERGTRFDPQVLDVFFERLDIIDQIGNFHKDVHSTQ
jgi:putative two-component system response regulator